MTRKTQRRSILCLVVVAICVFVFDWRQALAEAEIEAITADSAQIAPIPDDVWADMAGKSWHDDLAGCVSRDDLAFLILPYWDFNGQPQLGQLVVAKSVSQQVLQVFKAVFEEKSFAIARMDRVDRFGGDDDASMAANNTSAYNCRRVSGTNKVSSHGRGLAIDINPVQNPYVTSKSTSPAAGQAWDGIGERNSAFATGAPGIITRDSPIYRQFKAIGWSWGGDWKSAKDYQHFSADGR